MFLNGSMERNLDENDAAALKRDGAKKRLRFDEGEPDDRRKRSKPHEPKPVFTEYNWNDDGNKEECTMYSLNSTLVNCLDRDPIKTWRDSGIPQNLETMKMRATGKMRMMKEPLWFPSNRLHGSMNQANANWVNLFKHLDPGGRTSTMANEKFYEWAVRGVADPDFKYAVAQLPGYKDVGHSVSIIRSRIHPGQLLLVDSNERSTKALSQEAAENRHRWFMNPKAYLVIKHTD